MKKLTVQSSTQRYQVVIGENIRFQLQQFITKKYSAIMIITDETVANLFLEDIKRNFTNQRVYTAVVPNGEQSKSFDSYYHLQTKAIQNGLDRQSLIIALGGGVVGDLAGFVAATFLRGIDYIQIPTTILAHDSSVGGKVAINHELGKNLIGNFYAPTAVIYDVETLKTLPEQEIRSGYAELIKEALIADENFFAKLLQVNLPNIPTDQLKDYLLKGISIKAEIVERDEREAGERKFLNLGHTLAHALEAEYRYGTLAHGEAVAIGLLFAMYVSEQMLSANLPIKQLNQWLFKNNYPLPLKSENIDAIVNHMKQDKKAVQEQIQMVLLNKVGQPTVKVIKEKALKSFLKQFAKELGSS